MAKIKKKPTKKEKLKQLMKDLASLYSRIVSYEWDGKCALCGRYGTQAHHFFTKKAHPSVKWEIDNGCWMCFTCHIRKVHQKGETEALRDIYIKKIGQKRFDEIKHYAYNGLNRYRENDFEQLHTEMSTRLEELIQQKGSSPHRL
jgi:hypothetical protein